jgi:hypothetical protein
MKHVALLFSHQIPWKYLSLAWIEPMELNYISFVFGGLLLKEDAFVNIPAERWDMLWPVLDRVAINRDTPWISSTIPFLAEAGNGEGFVRLAKELVEKNILDFGATRDWGLPDGGCIGEGYYFFWDRLVSYKDSHPWRLRAGFSLVIHPGVQSILFRDICEVLSPSHCWYVPNWGRAGGHGPNILFQALERDYSVFRMSDEDPNLIYSKQLSTMLPRLGYEGSQYWNKPEYRLLPERIGWLNCWSAEIAQYLGFPDAEKDARILSLCSRTTAGHWIVQITEEPLDLARADHREAIAWAYWRFDKIGKRMQPKPPKPKTKPIAAKDAAKHGLKVFAIHERDENGNWWQSIHDPVAAPDTQEALRIFFAKYSHGRAPKPKETLQKLRDVYDQIAAEVGSVRAQDIDAVEVEAKG